MNKQSELKSVYEEVERYEEQQILEKYDKFLNPFIREVDYDIFRKRDINSDMMAGCECILYCIDEKMDINHPCDEHYGSRELVKSILSQFNPKYFNLNEYYQVYGKHLSKNVSYWKQLTSSMFNDLQ